jgi:hypothetical protein
MNRKNRKWRINRKMDNTKFLFLDKKLLNKNKKTYDKAVMLKMRLEYNLCGNGRRG